MSSAAPPFQPARKSPRDNEEDETDKPRKNINKVSLIDNGIENMDMMS